MTFKNIRIKSVLIIAVVLMFAGTFAAAAESYILGDANSDGIISVSDVTAIQKYLADSPVSGYSAAAADADGNGLVDITDAYHIQRWVAEFETPYQIGETIQTPTEPTTQSSTDEDGWGREIFRP